MPTSDDVVLFDTSAGIAFVDGDHVAHDATFARAASVRRGLAGHAAFEFLSVLTRLPGPKRLSGGEVRRLVEREFPHNRYLPEDQGDLVWREFVQRGIVGGMVYDGLVGACARYHDLTLLTCDQRAEYTYDLLGVRYEMLGAGIE